MEKPRHIMPWAERVARVLADIETRREVFIDPQRYPLDYQAALESVGKGLIEFDGATFRAKRYSKATHTPEPWVADDGDGQYFGIFDADGDAIAYLAEPDGFAHPLPAKQVGGLTPNGSDDGWKVDHQQHKANARRIVACVNACKGMRTETLERVAAGAPISYVNLEKQRDDLLVTLERYQDQLCQCIRGQVCEVCAAIANAKR